MIKKYTAIADTTITDAYKSNMTVRGTGSNQGESDSLQVFSVYGQQSSSSIERSRILVKFNVNQISTDRTDGKIPASGSVDFRLKLYNAVHSFTLPKKFTLNINAVSSSWDEGAGVDADSYTDLGVCNWVAASSASSGVTNWDTEGGDIQTASYVVGTNLPSYTKYFENGDEDLDVNITSLVEEWIADSNGTATDNNGVILYLTDESSPSSSYNKKFYARGSEYFYKRPRIEAVWDSSIKDRRGDFYASSSLASATDNSNTIYFYNRVRGQLKSIPGLTNDVIYVRLYDDSVSGSLIVATTDPITGGLTSTTGIYSASCVINTTASYLFDRWYNSNLTTCFHSGSQISVKKFTDGGSYNENPKYVLNIKNLKSQYSNNEIARLRIFSRQKNWNPNVYNVVTSDIPTDTIEDLYYAISRKIDDYECIPFGTGSGNEAFTKCSFDISGSYFDLNANLLEPGYMYELSFKYKKSSTDFEEIANRFKFRVEEE